MRHFLLQSARQVAERLTFDHPLKFLCAIITGGLHLDPYLDPPLDSAATDSTATAPPSTGASATEPKSVDSVKYSGSEHPETEYSCRNGNEYSGEIVLKVPPALHKKLIATAQREKTSLNQYLLSLISEKNALNGLDTLHDRLDDIQRHVQRVESRRDYPPYVGPRGRPSDLND